MRTTECILNCYLKTRKVSFLMNNSPYANIKYQIYKNQKEAHVNEYKQLTKVSFKFVKGSSRL